MASPAANRKASHKRRGDAASDEAKLGNVGQVTVSRATLDSIDVTWTPARGASSYRVEYSGGGAFSLARYVWYEAEGMPVPGNDTSFRATGLASDTAYVFRVTPVSDSGEAGTPSAPSPSLSTLTLITERERLLAETATLTARVEMLTHATDPTYIDRLQTKLSAKITRVEQLQQRLHGAKEAVAAAQAEAAASTSWAKELQEQLTAVTDTATSLQARLAASKVEVEAAAGRVASLTESLQAATTANTAHQTALETLRAETAAGRERIAALEAALEVANESLAVAKHEHAASSSAADVARVRVAALEAALMEATTSAAASKAELAVLAAARHAATAAAPGARAQTPTAAREDGTESAAAAADTVAEAPVSAEVVVAEAPATP